MIERHQKKMKNFIKEFFYSGAETTIKTGENRKAK
jgi:hypothetical protein